MNQVEHILGIAERLTEAQCRAVREAGFTVSKRWRVHYCHAGETMRSLTKLGLLGQDSSYLTPLGLAVRAHILQQSGGDPKGGATASPQPAGQASPGAAEASPPSGDHQAQGCGQ